ncbi:FAD-dependent oxidoreductase [Pelagicoccus sp. SDUM812003]|uniref:FAD-dependent oxidoreductase n=1 Tax=Pelagicoccus sp. SDUM812003 TaxID=3041267 RepID=UPI00280E26A8|nr:FAD-dependent oxidoreductase [Pelagicoccus sp. SDUM812003]MDQ8203704.1 FAD-dependent oxidoreductase [Pelagicoccus sp. SDUM812003]
MRILVVGNGMVSQRFAERLAEKRLPVQLTILGEEPHHAYDRVHLSAYFRHRDHKSLLLAKDSWYAKNGVQLLKGCRAVAIDRARKEVVTHTGERLPYDKLVLATGSTPFVPPIEGIDTEGVFTYRTIEDASKIIEYARGKKRGIALGGGLLGLEAANALRELGLATYVVEFANGLMPRQLNQDASMVLEKNVRELGVTPLLGKGARTVQRRNGGLSITFSDDTILETDLLVVAAGIRPRDDLAQASGLSLGARGGILVNDSLQTSDSDIYAIGECALHRGQIYGLVAPGYHMADILADRIEGFERCFEGADTSCRLKLLGVEVCAFGDNLGEGKTLVYRDAQCYRMLVLKRDCIAGATVVGDWGQIHQIQIAVKDQRFMSPSEQAKFEKTGLIDAGESALDWTANTMICNCVQISKGQISACVSNGCSSVSQLSKETGAGTVCGSCRPLLGQLVGATDEEAVFAPKGRRALLAASWIAASIVLALFLVGPLPIPTTVQDAYYQFCKLWTEELYKQISGYTMAGASLLALGLSARKRVTFARFGNFGWWRATHAILGSICLLALLAHTGLSFGNNLNLWLMSVFVSLNLVGALAGLTVAMEDRFTSPLARRIRSFVTRMHIVFFWPYPALLGFHIYKVYAY